MSLLSCPTSIIFVLELTWTQNVKTVPEIEPLIIYKTRIFEAKFE